MSHHLNPALIEAIQKQIPDVIPELFEKYLRPEDKEAIRAQVKKSEEERKTLFERITAT